MENCYFLHIYFFKVFVMPKPVDKAIIAWYLCQKQYRCLIADKFYSNPALFNVVNCCTRIFNYTSDKLTIQSLRK